MTRLGRAALFVGVRQRLPQASAGGVLVAFVLGQLAVAAMGWGRASGLVGMTEVTREPPRAAG